MYVCVCVCVSVGCIQLNAHPDAPAAARISRRSHQHCAAADEQGDETKCASPSKQEDICRKALTCTGITHLRMIALWQMKPPSTTTSTTTSTNISPPRLHHQFTFTLTTTSDPYGQKLSSTTPMPSATTTLASQSTALTKPTLCIYSICSLKPLMPCRGTLTNRTCAIERPPHWRSACKRVIGSDALFLCRMTQACPSAPARA